MLQKMRMYFPELINHYVEEAAATEARRVGLTIPQLHEPEIVSAIVSVFPSMMNAVLSRILGVRFGGCYIHQKPKAHFTMPDGTATSREIGDLLVVCRQVISGVETFNAAIFQMKMHDSSNDQHFITDPGELEQLYLYQHWPVFDCYKKKEKTTFDLYPKSPSQGAQYGIANRMHHRYQLRLYHSQPASAMSLYADSTFGDFLLDFIINQKGRVITPRADKDKDEWSRLVWYLIDMSWMSVYKLKRLSRKNQSRVGGDFFNMYSLMFQTKDDAGVEEMLIENREPYDEEIEGIPLLLIDAGEDFQLKWPRYKDTINILELL